MSSIPQETETAPPISKIKYIIDFVDSTSEQEIQDFFVANNCDLVKIFDNFTKTFVVETDNSLAVGGIIESVIQDNSENQIAPLNLYVRDEVTTATFDPQAEDNWWKIVVMQSAARITDVEFLRRGKNYPIYLVDSGIDTNHPDFANSNITNLFSFNSDFKDYNGHGTALASLMIGGVCGIASSPVKSVKIFQSGTPTFLSDLMSAFDRIATDHQANNGNRPAVVNMSWSIAKNTYVENKIRVLMNLGLVMVAAAGNEGVAIADRTPAGMADVITVGSFGTSLRPSDFSNYTGTSSISYTEGPVNYSPGLDIWCPGENLKAANLDNGFDYIAGTSGSTAILSALLSYEYDYIKINFGDNLTPLSGSIPEIMYNLNGRQSLTSSNIKQFTMSFIEKRDLVVLSELYSNCTKSVPMVSGVLENLEDLSFTEHQFYLPYSLIEKGVAVSNWAFDPNLFNLVSFTGLPNGLTFTGNRITGTLNQDLPEGSNFQRIDATMTLSDGTDEIVVNFFLVYYQVDRTQTTLEQFQQDQELLDLNLSAIDRSFIEFIDKK
jgi:hypothetical protein